MSYLKKWFLPAMLIIGILTVQIAWPAPASAAPTSADPAWCRAKGGTWVPASSQCYDTWGNEIMPPGTETAGADTGTTAATAPPAAATVVVETTVVADPPATTVEGCWSNSFKSCFAPGEGSSNICVGKGIWDTPGGNYTTSSCSISVAATSAGTVDAAETSTAASYSCGSCQYTENGINYWGHCKDSTKPCSFNVNCGYMPNCSGSGQRVDPLSRDVGTGYEMDTGDEYVWILVEFVDEEVPEGITCRHFDGVPDAEGICRTTIPVPKFLWEQMAGGTILPNVGMEGREMFDQIFHRLNGRWYELPPGLFMEKEVYSLMEAWGPPQRKVLFTPYGKSTTSVMITGVVPYTYCPSDRTPLPGLRVYFNDPDVRISMMGYPIISVDQARQGKLKREILVEAGNILQEQFAERDQARVSMIMMGTGITLLVFGTINLVPDPIDATGLVLLGSQGLQILAYVPIGP